MSDILNIKTAPHGSVWIFSIALPDEEIDAFGEETVLETSSSWPLGDALGVTPYPAQDGIEIFEAEALKEFGFSRYLSDANGLDLKDDAQMLNALTGHIVLIYDRALIAGQSVLAPQAPLHLIGRYAPAFVPPSMENLDSEGAIGELPQGKPPMSSARISGMVATYVLLFLFLFVIMFIWIA